VDKNGHEIKNILTLAEKNDTCTYKWADYNIPKPNGEYPSWNILYKQN
jgi:hypothetical protein